MPQIGQLISYATYDDGDYLMGVPWAKNFDGTTTPAKRFEAELGQPNCIIDKLTGLEWYKNPNAISMGTALTMVNNININGYCGHKD